VDLQDQEWVMQWVAWAIQVEPWVELWVVIQVVP
jgi:hypothetical protein